MGWRGFGVLGENPALWKVGEEVTNIVLLMNPDMLYECAVAGSRMYGGERFRAQSVSTFQWLAG
jgi:hypothetical protein